MNRGRKGSRTAVFLLIGVPAVILAAVLSFCWFREWQDKHPPFESGDATEETGATESGNVSGGSEPSGDSGEDGGTEEVIQYEPSEYDFKLDEIEIEIEGLKRGYDIAFVNDLHLITDTEPGDVLEENLPKVVERYDTLSVTPEGVHAEELWPEIIKFLNYYTFDAVIFGGDMLDYCSHLNIDTLAEGIDNLKYPKERILYIRSDHDYGGWYGGSVFTDTDGFIAQSEHWDGDKSEGFIEFDEFLIVGVNKSYQQISDDRLRFLEEKLGADKPVIVATHVPFYSEEDSTLEEKSMEVRNRIYYWNRENSSYSPDKNTQKFIDHMYDEDSNVIQIVAAHLHGSWDGIVANDLREHIFAPSFEGRIGIIHVIPAKSREER